jgi:hypothetical protein
MLVVSFPTSGVNGESWDIGLVVKNVSIDGDYWVPAISLLVFFLLVLLDLLVCEVTVILPQAFELFRYGTKALLGEELVWPEDLRLANEEVASLQLRVFC